MSSELRYTEVKMYALSYINVGLAKYSKHLEAIVFDKDDVEEVEDTTGTQI